MQPQIMPAYERWVTAEEFSRIPNDDYHYELVEGRVVRVSPPGSRHAVLAMQIAALLHGYVMAHGLGRVMTPAGFTLARNPDTVREPDVAFVRQDHIPKTGVPDGYWPGPPDLAIEVRSSGDRTVGTPREGRRLPHSWGSACLGCRSEEEDRDDARSPHVSRHARRGRHPRRRRCRPGLQLRGQSDLRLTAQPPGRSRGHHGPQITPVS